MAEMKDDYDFSDYPKAHQLHDETNKKDECAGTPIAEYIGLRPKLYSVLRADEQPFKKAKGVKNNMQSKNK